MGDFADQASREITRKCSDCGEEFTALSVIVADGLLYNHKQRKHKT